MGPGNNTGSATYWDANTVRLPLSEGFWLKGDNTVPGCSPASYQGLVKRTVDTLTALKLNVILDLQWTDVGGQVAHGGGPAAMPDADSLTFWQQVAPVYQGYSNVLFEVYNEPHPAIWPCWIAACTMTNDDVLASLYNYQSVGMQAVVDAVRGTGATNLILVGGMNWGYNLSQISNYKIDSTNIVYDTHPYPYSDKLPATWDTAFGNASATYPVIAAETGEYQCTSSYTSQLLPYFDAHQIGWLAWSWVARGDVCGYPQLVTDYQGTPSSPTGQYVYQHLHSYAFVSGPSSKTWYFAEGRVGGNFSEFITLGNADPTNDCPVTLQYVLENGTLQTHQIIVPRASRTTESVNADLGVAPSGPGVSVSTIVTVSAPSPCIGIVAERPMYFNFHGNRGGTDVVGATHTARTFYLADVPYGGGYSSFITILNPPGGQAATVSATYYSNGAAFATLNATVQPGQRGTLLPTNGANFTRHAAVLVQSTQPVVVERPTYFTGINGGFAGTVTGAASVVGAETLQQDWYFAEGYVGQNASGGRTQENLVIANLDEAANATASVTISLEYLNGTTHNFNVSVPANSQLIWNVNTQSVNAPSREVSASVHALAQPFGSKKLSATGGTEVTGLPTPIRSYSFAEGYNNTGYNEWLTLQNPTASAEDIIISLTNGYGRVYSMTQTLGAHARFTLDITYLVLRNMLRAYDDHRGYEISIALQAPAGSLFVAERPEYFDAGQRGLPAFVRGGSDAFGYTGS
jgi:hypothetical protein